MVKSSGFETPLPEKRYEESHWIRSRDAESALNAYLEQQGKSYSRVKNAFLCELMGDLRGRRFLDFGCGAGLFLLHAVRQGAALAVGVDAEETVLKTARYFLGKYGPAGRCRLVCGRTLPFCPSFPLFDVVLLKDVLEHVADDRELLRGAARILAPGGCIVVATQNSLSLNFLVEGAVRKFFCRERNWVGWDPTHLRFYSPGALRDSFGEAGLDIVAWRSAYVIPHKLPVPGSGGKRFLRIEPLSSADRVLGKLHPFRMLGWNIMVRGEKRQDHGAM